MELIYCKSIYTKTLVFNAFNDALCFHQSIIESINRRFADERNATQG